MQILSKIPKTISFLVTHSNTNYQVNPKFLTKSKSKSNELFSNNSVINFIGITHFPNAWNLTKNAVLLIPLNLRVYRTYGFILISA